MARTCSARPISPAPSYAVMEKVSRRPSTAVSSLSQRTSMPTGVAAVCSRQRRTPTLVRPAPSSGATLAAAARSMHAASAGVANTGSSPLPMARAVFSAQTAHAAWPRTPGRNCPFRSGPAAVSRPLTAGA